MFGGLKSLSSWGFGGGVLRGWGIWGVEGGGLGCLDGVEG